MDAWLDFVSQGQAGGRKIAEVDYDTYAAGEAALGWMNASAKLQARGDIDWKAFAGELAGGDSRRAARPLGGDRPPEAVSDGQRRPRGGQRDQQRRPASPCAAASTAAQRKSSLLINARVHVQPDVLRAAVEEALPATAGDRLEATITNMRSFFPGRPQPTYRYEAVV